MKILTLIFCAALVACQYDDHETASLNKHYAQIGDQMTTTIERVPKTNPKPGQTSQLNTTNAPPVF